MNRKHSCLLLALVLCPFFPVRVQAAPKCLHSSICTETDSLIFNGFIKKMAKKSHLPLEKTIVSTALSFLEVPYVAATLEQPGGEHLVVNLRQFDCTTFVENCVALALTIKSGETTFANYKSMLQQLRYRGGLIDGYASRLHYASDWIADNARKGIWEDLTPALGGIRQDKILNFMSSHPKAYPALADDSLMRQQIARVEAGINARKDFFLLPKENIRAVAKDIRDGDLVFFGTKIDGLDFSHMGIAYHDKGVLTFIHASSAGAKVLVQPSSLEEYCRKSKNCNGIAVVRPHLAPFHK